jgi:hypothetical protein
MKPRSGGIRWGKRDEVFVKCPPFILFTNQSIGSSSPHYWQLCKWLDLPRWNSELNLKKELEIGVEQMKDSLENWEAIQRFVFQALSSLLPLLPTFSESIPSWIMSILRLKIFPVTTRNGNKTIQALNAEIFVPDSILLNQLFQGKVDLLDFGQNCVWDILPILRCSDVPMQYLSYYDDQKAMRIIPPVAKDPRITAILVDKRVALTR